MRFFQKRPSNQRLPDLDVAARKANDAATQTPNRSGPDHPARAGGHYGPSSSEASASNSDSNSNRPKFSNVSLSAWLRLARPKLHPRPSSPQTAISSTTNFHVTTEPFYLAPEQPPSISVEATTTFSDTRISHPPTQSGLALPVIPPKPSPSTGTTNTSIMAERTLQQIITQLKGNPSYDQASSLLSKAKLSLLQLKALTPTSSTPSNLLSLARDVYELGALTSIRARNPDAFTRYVQQLQPFYELPSSQLKPNPDARNKVTGLYLLLLLTQGRYDVFHSELESLSTRVGNGGFEAIEADRYLGYPIKLERWLMEGAYDRVWKAMKKGEVPSEEFGVFSSVSRIRISPDSSPRS